MCALRAFEDCVCPAPHNIPPGGALCFSAQRDSAPWQTIWLLCANAFGLHPAGFEFIKNRQNLINPIFTELVCSHGVSEKTQASLSTDSLKRWVRWTVTHRLPDRIRAHAMLCFIALILYRVMRGRLKLAGVEVSPERALKQLRAIQRHRVRINDDAPIDGISSIDAKQAHLFQAFNLPKPTRDAQIPLL